MIGIRLYVSAGYEEVCAFESCMHWIKIQDAGIFSSGGSKGYGGSRDR